MVTKPIIVTTPRQTTTSNAAEYSAICMDVPIFLVDDKCEPIQDINNPGDDKRIDTGNRYVGFKYDGADYYDRRQTKLLFATDGTIKQMVLMGDPDLSNFGGVIIDEAHERSVNIDVLIALVLEICKRRPHDFKVIIMSATIDPKLFTNYFEKVGLKGRYTTYIPQVNNTQFTVTKTKEARRIDQSKMVDIVYNKIENIIMNPTLPTGDILACVTSEPDTDKIVKLIKRNMHKFANNKKPYPIAYTAITKQTDKDIATKKNILTTIRPTHEAPNGYAFKVIIATNVVESSVTFEDPLVYVIESGLAFEKIFDAKHYCYNTGKNYVSQASITQRCGRTGRKNAGYCYQLYTDQQFNDFKVYTLPKIVLEDITKEILALSCLPMHNNAKLGLEFLDKMIEPTKHYKDAIEVGYKNLVNMALITKSGDITPLGYVCNSFGKFDIRIARMIICGYYLGSMWYCMILGAILQDVKSVSDFFPKPAGMEQSEADEIALQNMLKFKDESGDHFTLLKIYDAWERSPNKKEFCLHFGINNYSLVKIKKKIEDIHKVVKKLQNEIKSLWLFGVPQDIMVNQDGIFYGGGKSKNANLSNDSSNYYYDKEDLEFDNVEKKLNTVITTNDPQTSTNTQSSDSHNNSLYNIKGGGSSISVSDQFDEVDRMWEVYQQGGDFMPEITQLLLLDEMKGKRANAKKTRKCGMGDTQNAGGISGVLTVKNGGGKKDDEKAMRKEAEEKQKNVSIKLEKIMNAVDLKDLQPMYLNVPADKKSQILGALFYGFCTNIASFSGAGKKYNVKYSDLKGSITKSILDIINVTPELILYHEFIISQEQNRENAKLSIVSKLGFNIITLFLNLQDIKKQIS